jgi:predicted DNA-binding transcriptional regulator AlpA
MENLKNILIRELEEVLHKLKTDTCELSEVEAMDILSAITHQPLSREEAYDYLNCSRATFENLMKAGKIPRGRKTKGRTGLVWYKDELDKVLRR